MKKFTELSLNQYLQELSSPEAVPGGGSVSAYVASLAMGLTQMVGRISLKRKKKDGLSPEENQKEDERRAKIQTIVDSVESLKQKAFPIVDLDPEVYGEVGKAYGQPEKMETALWKSFQMQADLVSYAVAGRAANHELMHFVSGSIKNDLLVSDALSQSAFIGAYDTAMINVVYMKNPENKKKAEEALAVLKSRFEEGCGHAH